MAHNIPKTQKAAIFHKHGGPITIETLPVTQPEELKAGQVLVKVIYSGVCATDAHVHNDDWPIQSKLPLIGGHEGAGFIAAIGQGSETPLKLGDRVGIKWLATSCLACEFCRQGQESLCQSALCSGFQVDGSFQQYAVSYANHVSPIPDDLPLEAAAPIMCAGETVYRAILNSNLSPGGTVAVIGAGGGLGHMAIQYATAMGYRVLAVDTGEDKQALCTQLGAEAWIDYKTCGDLVKALKDDCDGLGPNAIIVAASNPESYEVALAGLRSGGTLVAVGLPRGAAFTVPVFDTVLTGKHIVGSYVGNRQDAVEALQFAARGKVKSTERIAPLSELPEIYAMMHQGKITGRVVLDLGHENKTSL